MALNFSAEAEKKLEGILPKYPNKEAALLPVLARFGWTSPMHPRSRCSTASWPW